MENKLPKRSLRVVLVAGVFHPLPKHSRNQYVIGNRVKRIPILSIVFTLVWPYPYRQLWPFFSFCHNGHHRYGHIMAMIRANEG